jgi:flavin-dependent dehydrogenase
MVMTLETEVCVVGGGPAGSTAARQLARLGHDVCLLERAAFPRPHVGESLSPGLLDLLATLGLRQRAQAHGLLSPRALVRWSGEPENADKPGLQVDRGRFDQALWEAAAESGVRALQRAKVARPRRETKGWTIPVRCGGEPIEVRAGFLVDATGRSSVLGGRKRRCAAPLAALHGRWQGLDSGGAETRVEAGPDEWLWGAPLPDGTWSAMVFLEPARCARSKSRDLEGLYRTLLARSTLLRFCLRGRLAGGVRVCDASSYADDRPVDETSIKVGEAAFALDPLSSQGVQAAVQTAIQGSIVAHTLLSCPAHAAAAVDFYRARQAEAVERHARLAARYYSEQRLFPESPFWRRRAAPADAGGRPALLLPDIPALVSDSPLRLAEGARLVSTPCIRGDLVVPLRALEHPGLERPVAFLGGIELAPLLEALPRRATISEILRKWAERVPSSEAVEVLRWMWRNRILTPAG